MGSRLRGNDGGGTGNDEGGTGNDDGQCREKWIVICDGAGVSESPLNPVDCICNEFELKRRHERTLDEFQS